VTDVRDRVGVAARRAAEVLDRLTGPALVRSTVPTFDEVAGAWCVRYPPSTWTGPQRVVRTAQPGALPVIEDLRREPTARCWRPRVAMVPDGTLVTRSGAVVSRDHRLVLESLWDDHHYRREFARSPAIGRPVRLPGRWASLLAPWSGNYFHWLFDCLPRLRTLHDGGFADVDLVVPAGLAGFQRDSLAAAGVSARRLTAHGGDSVRADELVWPSTPDFTAYPTERTMRWLRTEIGARVAGSAGPGGRRLVIVRPSRRIANLDALLDALRPYRFEPVEPAGLAFDDQVRLFAQAEFVIGVHGAGLSNICWSTGATVLEIFYPEFVNPGMREVALACGHDYWYAVGTRVGRWRRRKYYDVLAPLTAVRDTVSAVLG
jgi:capsular polysaccharide biosynthesis protein